jgi:hypothetical protein
VLLVVGNDANDQTYSKRAPFYNALTSHFRDSPLDNSRT